MTAPRVHIETFGCQMNEYDSELVRSLLRNEGFTLTPAEEGADVVLVNTCAVRENAHEKVYARLAQLRTIRRLRPLVVGVLGCMAQNLKSELMREEPVVDLVVGPDSYRQLPLLLTNALQDQERGHGAKRLAVDLSEYETYGDILPERQPGVNAWIAIMRGCDNFCTFCVVPYTRGRERSRDPDGVLRETRELVQQGYKQVSLLGQNVNSYRHDDWDFARLITAVADVPGIERVRFTSPHPKDFPMALLEAIAQHPKICKHVHLPLQSGNDRILNLMDRTYTRRDYVDLVDTIRKTSADICLTTDVICGFCSETEEEFQDTYRLMEQVGFHSAYVFKYSERKHTIAARKYQDDVPESVKIDRVARLVDLNKRMSYNLNQARVGQTVEVLVEGESKRSTDQWMGKTNDILTVVWEKSPRDGVAPGALVRITVESASVTTLFGHPYFHRMASPRQSQ